MSNPSTTPTISIPIIGYHRSPLSQKFGIPRQPNLVAVKSMIEMLPPYNTPEAFAGLDAFSHLWISWQTHHNQPQRHFKPKVRPPRLGGNDRLGVFATRSTYRPSQLGLSVVKLEAIEQEDNKVVLYISGADMVDGTPIIDIKPYVAYSDAILGAISGFAPDKPVLKPVVVNAQARQTFDGLLARSNLSLTAANWVNQANDLTDNNSLSSRYIKHTLTDNDLDIISQLISQDPRPAYRQHEVDSVFMMRYKRYDICFRMQADGRLEIIDIVEITDINQSG